MANIQISKVDTLPEISRSGRRSEELNQIIEAIKISAQTNSPMNIQGVKAGNAYNSMQQRIRAQAKNLGYKIVIRFDSANSVLYFQAFTDDAAKEKVDVSAVAGAKAKNKTK